MASIVPMSFFTPDETINPNEYTFEIADAATRSKAATLESVIYKREALTTTYTQNQYVTSSDFSGIAVRRHGLLYAIDGNLYISNAITTDYIEIGRINNYSSAKPIRLQIPNSYATAILLLNIYDDGIIKIAGSNTSAGWYRFHAVEAVWSP